MIIMQELIEQLIRHEGVKLHPYRCSVGRLTIGVGRNIEDNGITHDEAIHLLKNDIRRCAKEVSDSMEFFTSLNAGRQQALINMCFNMGISRLLRFKKMIQALREGDYDKASAEALDSRWANQVGARAIEIAEQLKGE